MLGFTREGFHPIDAMRERFDSVRAHPLQSGLSALFGAAIPGGGLLANAGFDRYNRNQFNNSAQSGYDRSLQSTTMDANTRMRDPLNGPLGQFDNVGGDSSGAPQNDNRQLAQAMQGNPGSQASNYRYGQFNPMQQQQYSPTVNSILDSIGPNGPGLSGNGGGGGNGGGMGGMGQNGGFGGMLAGGGFNGIMNGASPGMMADFAAPTSGDWMQRLQSHTGAQGTYRGASQR